MRVIRWTTSPIPMRAKARASSRARQSLRRLEAALARLPVRQREAFQLRVWEGLSVDDAALAMSCSAGSVKTHLFRAMQALKGELDYDFGTRKET